MCAGGMSSSLLANKLETAGIRRYENFSIQAYGVSEVSKVDETIQVILLAPQVSYMYDSLVEKIINIPIYCIEMMDYGRLNAENILNKVEMQLKRNE